MKFTTVGMSIIEISIALTISSFLTLALYQSFNTAQKNSQSISATMNAEHVFSIAYNQLDKDFSTIFVPERFFAQLSKSPDKTSEKTSEAKSFKDIFTPTLKDKNLESITFLSTHSLPLYNSKSPYAVRVVYRLIKQENNEWYALVRQESTKLDLPIAQFKEKNIPSYDLISNIKSLSITFTVTEKEKKEESEKKESKPKKYVPLNVWPQSKDEKKPEYIVPAYITLKGIFVDGTTEREYDFEWIFPVPVYNDVMQRLAHSDKKNEKKTEEKKEIPKEPEKKETSSENKKETSTNKNQKQNTTESLPNQKAGNGMFGLNMLGNKF